MYMQSMNQHWFITEKLWVVNPGNFLFWFQSALKNADVTSVRRYSFRFSDFE